MKFYTGDIVEIINLSHEQIYSIRGQRCNFNINVQDEIIGMRYIIQVGKSYDGKVFHRPIGWNHGGFIYSFEPSQFRLHKRPLKNWWKLFVEKMKTRKSVQK